MEEFSGRAEMGRNSSSSSSSEEDGDEEWRAAITSIASFEDPFLIHASKSASAGSIPDGSAQASLPVRSAPSEEDDEPSHHIIKSRLPKHYQIKAQKLLDEILEKKLEIVKDPNNMPDNNVVPDEGGIRLFKNAPLGIVFDHIDEHIGPKKKPKILPGEEIDEKSKKFVRQLKSVVVDGFDVMATAKSAAESSLARLEAKEARAKAAVKREEERVAELKRIRGERWLPSIAKEMRLKPQGKKISN